MREGGATVGNRAFETGGQDAAGAGAYRLLGPTRTQGDQGDAERASADRVWTGTRVAFRGSPMRATGSSGCVLDQQESKWVEWNIGWLWVLVIKKRKG